MAIAGQRPDIERKIALISSRIVRGQLAGKNRPITLFRIKRAAIIVASSLTSIGLTNPLLSLLSDKKSAVTVSQVFSDDWYGLPEVFSFVGVGIFVLGGIALAFYKQEHIEEKAIQSLGLAEAFDRLELDLQNGLAQEEPIEQLNVVYNTAIALETSNFKVMPKEKECETAIREYTKEIIDKYRDWWKASRPDFERRER